MVKTLEQLITDDYVLVYLHGGASRTNAPTFHWLRSCYQLLDRRLRKSMRTLYVVHPSVWLKSMVVLMRPFIRWVANCPNDRDHEFVSNRFGLVEQP